MVSAGFAAGHGAWTPQLHGLLHPAQAELGTSLRCTSSVSCLHAARSTDCCSSRAHHPAVCNSAQRANTGQPWRGQEQLPTTKVSLQNHDHGTGRSGAHGAALTSHNLRGFAVLCELSHRWWMLSDVLACSADPFGLGCSAHRGPQHGRHDRNEACIAVAPTRVLTQHRQRDGRRLAEPPLQLARRQVHVEGAASWSFQSNRLYV
jgi:hypothetical protein